MTKIDKFPGAAMRAAAPPPTDPADDAVDVLALFRLVRRRLGLIVAVTGLLTAAAVPPILDVEKTYYAESRLLIQSSLVAAEAGREDQLDLATEVERLRSRPIAERVIREFVLDRREEFNASLREEPLLGRARGALRSLLGVEGAESAAFDTMDRVVPEFYQALTIRRNGTSEIVEIGFSSRDPDLAAEIPNALLRTYFEERERKLRNRIEVADAYILARIAEQRQRVADADAAVTAFRESSGVVSIEAQADIAQTASSLGARRADILRERAELTAVLSAARSADGLEAVESEVLQELRRDRQIQRLELSRLQATYGRNQSDVAAARARLHEIEAAIGSEAERRIQSMRSSLATLEEEDRSVLSALDLSQSRLSSVILSGAELGRLLRKAEREQSGLDALDEQRRGLLAQAGLAMVEAEILSPATVPQKSEGRSRMIYLIAAFAAAAALALTAACVRELLDKSVRSHQQLRRHAGLVSAGMIPALPRRTVRNLERRVRSYPDSMFADAMRGVMFSLERSNGGSMPRSLLVTSALAGEGKTLLAAALAVEVSLSQQRVLLVDCNPRPGSTRFPFGTGKEPGLSDLLGDERTLADVTHRDGDSGIDYIPWGTRRASLFHERHAITRILESAQENGQLVIFDSAPVLATTEAALLAQMADRTLLVLRWARTSRRAAGTAVERLQNAMGDNLLVAINRVKPRRHALYGFEDAEIYSLLRPSYLRKRLA